MKCLTLNLGALSVTGGIERYAGDLHRALGEVTARTVTLSLWDRNDPGACARAGVDAATYHGCGRSKMRFLVRLVRMMRRERPDVVWLTHVLFLPVLPLVRLLAPRARVVVSAYGIDVWSPLSPLHRWLLRRVDRVVAITEFTASRMAAAQGLDPKSIALLPPLVAPRFARAKPAVREIGSSGRVLTVARLGDDADGKGLYTAVHAFAAAAREAPDAHLTVVGDGPAREQLQRVARSVGAAGRVTFTGRLSDEELARAYDTHDVFLLPSRKEGFGIVFVEAMANGLAVIAGNRDAAPEVVDNGETGRLVDPQDTGAVRDALLEMIRDPERTRALGEVGRTRAPARFGPDRYRHRLKALLGSLATSSSGRRAGRSSEGGRPCAS